MRAAGGADRPLSEVSPMGFYQFAKNFSPALRLLFGVRVIGMENIPEEGPVILCSNHRSNFDPVIYGA